MWPFSRREARSSLEDPKIPLSDIHAWNAVFGAIWNSASGVSVTVDKALGVPAIWCAVAFLAKTMASLPLDLYRQQDDSGEAATNDPLYGILHDSVNDDMVTSYKWRMSAMVSICTSPGRAFTFIERNKAGRVMNLWPLDAAHVKVRRENLKTFYDYQDGDRKVTYRASEIIDIPFLLFGDGVRNFDVVATLRNSIGLSIAAEAYASLFFQNGGVPPLAMQGPAGASAPAIRRASQQILEAIQDANKDGKHVLYMPNGHRLEAVGFDPQKGQLTEARLFQIQEVSRIYNLPPVFIHDLSRATFTNAEQQDLNLVKHTILQWVKAWEQELNAKLFGARNRKNYVKFNIDGLLRGDFKTRMEGFAQGIQNGILEPDEARELEDRPRRGGAAAKLYINSASVPLGSQPVKPTTTQPTGDENAPAAQ